MRRREFEVPGQSIGSGAQRAARRAAGSHAALDDYTARGNLRGAGGLVATALSSQCIQCDAVVRVEKPPVSRRTHCRLRRSPRPTLELLRVLCQVFVLEFYDNIKIYFKILATASIFLL